MNHLSTIKKKMKQVSAPVAAAGAVVVGAASSASAAIDYTSVQTTVTDAVADLVAGGVILLGAYAGYWGIKKVKEMFAKG